MALFSVIDYLVFCATISISACIGLFFGIRDRKKSTPDDYFLAGRKFRILPAALSFVITFQSSQMLLGCPVEVYMYGTVFCYTIVGIILSYTISGIIIVPVFHNLKLTSVYKYFELRYQNNAVRYMVMSGAMIYIMFYIATVTYGTCVALEYVMGIPYWATVLLYTTVVTIYTSIGGIKAVIWTDVFQMLIMTTGILAVLLKTTIEVGGVGKVFEIGASRMNMDDFKFDIFARYNFWNVSTGTFCIFFYCTCAQAGIQRINSTPSVKTGRWLYIISGPIFAVIWILTAIQGVTVFAYHTSKGCDPIASGRIDNVNGLIPVTMVDLFKNIPGMSGLFIASLSSAVLSTLSSCLNSLSAITYDDIIKVKFPDISDNRATMLSKGVVLIYGLFSMALTFVVSKIPGSITIIFASLMGCMEGPTCAIFILSLMFRRGTTKGMMIGGLTGMIFTLWISLGRMTSSIPPDPVLQPGPVNQCYSVVGVSLYPPNTTHSSLDSTSLYNTLNHTYSATKEANKYADELTHLEKFYSLSAIAYSFIGMVTTLFVGTIVSLFTKPPTILDERCLFSFSKHLFTKRKNESDISEEEMEPMSVTG